MSDQGQAEKDGESRVSKFPVRQPLMPKAYEGVCVGGVWDGKWKSSDFNELVAPIMPRESLADWHGGLKHDVDEPIKTETQVYAIHEIRCPNSDGDMERFFFWAPSHMSPANVIQCLVDRYLGILPPKAERAA